MHPAPLRLLLSTKVRRGFRPLVDIDLLRRVIERALALEELTGDVEVSLLLTDDLTVRRLNARHRGIDSTTDVLSFPLAEYGAEGGKGFISPPGSATQLGDIAISVPRAKAQAVEYGHSFEREIAYLAVHGLLHLLGYDHEDDSERNAMRAKEEAALREVLDSLEA